MSKKLLNCFYPFSCDQLDGLTFSEVIQYFKDIEMELSEEGAIDVIFLGDNIPYEGESLSIRYSRYETDKEYEQRLKHEFDQAEIKRIKAIQGQLGKNYILLKDDEFIWEEKDFKVEYTEGFKGGLLDTIKKDEK